MSETPGRIEREMAEIRSRMSPDMKDLRKHIEAQIVTEQVKQTIGQRLRQAADRSKEDLKAKQKELTYSAKLQRARSPWPAARYRMEEGSSRLLLPTLGSLDYGSRLRVISRLEEARCRIMLVPSLCEVISALHSAE